MKLRNQSVSPEHRMPFRASHGESPLICELDWPRVSVYLYTSEHHLYSIVWLLTPGVNRVVLDSLRTSLSAKRMCLKVRRWIRFYNARDKIELGKVKKKIIYIICTFKRKRLMSPTSRILTKLKFVQMMKNYYVY